MVLAPVPPVTPSPTPSAVPLVVELVGKEVVPWWGVPVIAGLFLVVGGLLTFLYTRVNERTSAMRELRANWDGDLLERGAGLLASGDKVRDISLLALPRTSVQMASIVVRRGAPAMDEFRQLARRFMLIMPESFQEDFESYMAWTLALLVPPYRREGQLYALSEHARATWALEERLRSLRQLGGLHREAKEEPDVLAQAERALSTLLDDIRGETQDPSPERGPENEK